MGTVRKISTSVSDRKSTKQSAVFIPSYARNLYSNLNGVIKLLANINPDKAAGINSIKPIILQELRLEIAPVICLLFEKSLKSGQLPAEWTKAQVCPLFKKGDKTYPANYRPISLTFKVCKVMEHVITSSISKHLTRHNVLYKLQHGFREKCSCETQLIQLVEVFVRRLTLGKQIDLVLLDFSKAFDKVNLLKLLYKFSIFGTTETTLKWIEAFFIGQSQTAVLDGESSNEVPVTSGLPHGSVLGPLLLLLYIIFFFDLGVTSLSTIFQSYRDGVWMWQGAQCSLLECCLTEISCPKTLWHDIPPSHIILTLSWPVPIPSFTFLMLSAKRKSS